MKMIFLGPPGAGKGTIASKAKDLFGIPHVSTGDLFRENVKNETELGSIVKKIMESGELVPDEVTVAMVKERLGRSDASEGFILDGFPRTIGQAEALAEITDLDLVVNFVCPEESLIRRLTGRRQCRSCQRIYHVDYMPPRTEGLCDVDGGELYTRDDDKIEAVKRRLDVYAESTKPLIAWYESKGLIRNVDADAPVERVLESVKDVAAS